MNKVMQNTAPSAAPRFWAHRLHGALMPDYNRRATAYWWLTVTIGVGVLAQSTRVLSALPSLALAEIVAGVVAAMLAGLFAFRVPRSKNSFTAGEIFIFLLLLLHGPAAATLAAAGEGLVGSWRTSKRWTSRIVSPATAGIAMFLAGSLLEAVMALLQPFGFASAAVLLVATTCCALLYFLVNTALITAVPYVKRGKWPTIAEMFASFGWVGICVVGSAPVACLLYVAWQHAGVGVLLVSVPMAAMLLVTLHYNFRQQQANEAMRKSHVEAIEREAELGARHVRELEASERRFHSAFTHASIGMALVSPSGRVLQVNSALRGLIGLGSYESIAQRPFSDFVEADGMAELNGHLAQLNAAQVDSFEVELRLRHGEGEEVWAAVHGSFISQVETAAPSLILQVQGVTARRQAEARLQHIAFHDALTLLPNRRRFQDDLAAALIRSQAQPGRHCSLMFLDFDRFKRINDSFGHAIGDEFLVAVARRISHNVRSNDVVARLGGDEFAILTDDGGDDRYAVTLAERLLEVLRQPFRIAGNDIVTSASIGITFSGLGYVTPSEMLRDADTAMYKAKANGKARYALFDGVLHTEMSHRLRLERDLRGALETGQLSLAYQPIFDLGSRRITGFEALARWQHPEFGAISPISFVAIAEDAGLAFALTDFVLRAACAQLREWQLRDDAFVELDMHVNLSPNDLAHPNLVARVSAALDGALIRPHHLTLEVTEDALMRHLDTALAPLAELRRRGMGVSVDNFGTGYSSLRRLATLPVTSLKIDRSFVGDVQRHTDDVSLLHALVMLASGLGKAVIAEGIESAVQLEQLRRVGCRSGQGNHLARPLAAERIDRVLEAIVVAGRDMPKPRDVCVGLLLH
ncbi:MAG: EAL domain-containing protein [Caldimonas sp.]